MQRVNYRLLRSMPWVIAVVVTVATWQWHNVSRQRVQPFELWLFDQRVRSGIEEELANENFGLVKVDDGSLKWLKATHGLAWPLPRFTYGLVVEDVMAEGASDIAFDMGFDSPGSPADDQHLSRLLVTSAAGSSSDKYFADAMKRTGRAVIGVKALHGREPSVVLPAFRDGVCAVGHMRGYPDSHDVAEANGVFRHVDPFVTRSDGTIIWQLGIQAVAARMKLDLAQARIEQATWFHGRRVVIPQADGGTCIIPLDHAGQITVHWSIAYDVEGRPQPPTKALASSVSAALNRPKSPVKTSPRLFANRIVFVGSTASDQLRDRGAMPYHLDVPMVILHMNVAASLLSGRMIWMPPDAGLIAMFGLIAIITTFVTWHLRVEWATLTMVLVAAGYFWFTGVAYRHWQLVLPTLSPLVGAIGASYLSVLVFRVIVERGRVGRVKTLFERLIAPNMIEILMEQRTLPWNTTQRNITVLFADIRGFTAYTDQQDFQAEKEIEELKLSGEAAVACRNRYAAESLESVNLYLATIVDAVKKHGGTLDKYIGDCVMAFWGAPVSDSRHAANAVRSAMDAQRRVSALNAVRQRANEQIAADNRRRIAMSEITRSLQPTLTLGIAIHTGEMIVGFMGSERHLSNYTVFGKNVNIASRMEKFAGSGRIVTTKPTFEAVQSIDSVLAKSMTLREEEVSVKGIIEKLTIYDVQS